MCVFVCMCTCLCFGGGLDACTHSYWTRCWHLRGNVQENRMCMWVCTYMCVYVYMCVCVCACTCMRMPCVCAYAYACARVCACVCACAWCFCLCVYGCACGYMRNVCVLYRTWQSRRLLPRWTRGSCQRSTDPRLLRVSHITHMNGSRHTQQRFLSYVSMRHVAHMNEKSLPEIDKPKTAEGESFTHIHGLFHTYERVLSHVRTSHVAHVN